MWHIIHQTTSSCGSSSTESPNAMHANLPYTFVINVLVHYTDEILHVLYVCTVYACVLCVLHVHVYNVIVCVVVYHYT